jgi:hypothetical protein
LVALLVTYSNSWSRRNIRLVTRFIDLYIHMASPIVYWLVQLPKGRTKGFIFISQLRCNALGNRCRADPCCVGRALQSTADGSKREREGRDEGRKRY